MMAIDDFALFKLVVAHQELALIVRSECQPMSRGSGADEAVLTPMLSHDAQRMLLTDNAGGSSRISEALSMECLGRAFGAKLLSTEMELRYWPSNGSITDYSITFGDTDIAFGVSVTRAMSRPGEAFSVDSAEALLLKKLNGVLRSSQTCISHDMKKQILHVWARSEQDANALERAYAKVDAVTISSTIVLITVCSLDLLFDEKARKVSPSRNRVQKGLKDALHLQILRESDPTRMNVMSENIVR